MSAFLFFWLELHAVKSLLPSFGGAAAVWTGATLIFQLVLLLSYIWEAGPARLMSPRRHAGWRLALLLAACAFLPPAAAARADGAPLWALSRSLAAGLLLPFFYLGGTLLALQRGARDAGRRARLYAASNAGSLAALAAYPFVLEPLLDLDAQALLWTALFAACGVLQIVAAPRSAGPAPRAPRAPAAPRAAEWILLAAAPAAAMAAATNFLGFHLPSTPLLWILPLSVYLATLVFFFARRPGPSGRAEAACLLAGLILLVPAAGAASGAPAWDSWVPPVALALDALGLLAVCLVGHRSLARALPADESEEPAFYACAALGGLLGTAVVVVAVSVLGASSGWPGLDWLAAGGVALLALIWRDRALWRARWSRSPARVAAPALSAAAAIAAAALLPSMEERVFQGRSFYGTVAVVDDDGVRVLRHDGTLHGAERLSERGAARPMAYFSPGGPCGDLFTAYGPSLRRAALVGLGAGSMAAYGRPGQEFVFFELDGLVARAARDSFDFLREAKARTRVEIEDGRLGLAAAPDASFDLIVLDAFSGGSIPVHLLTSEAFALYRRKLSARGVIAVHASHRLLDLRPAAADAALAAGLSGRVKDGGPDGPGLAPSRWLALSADAAVLDKLPRDWMPLSAFLRGRPWTDKRSSPLRALYSALTGT